MNKSKDNDQTFVLKILDDLRSSNRNNPLRMDYNNTLGITHNDSLLSTKRHRSCSPDLEQSLIGPVASPWEFRHTKQELVNAHAEIASLQERNKTLFNLKKESDLLFEKEKAALEHSINKSKLTIDQLENKLKEIRYEKLNLKDENDILMKKIKSVTEENQCKTLYLEKENKNLEDKLNNVTLELNKCQNEIASRNCTNYELNELKNTLRSNEKYIDELTSNLKKKQIEINALENDQVKMNIANQKIKLFEVQKRRADTPAAGIQCLENELASLQENAMVVNAQREKLKRFNFMENELISLREEVAIYRNDVKQTEILENKVATLENKLNKHELIEKEAMQLRSNLAVSNDCLKNWINVCREVCENVIESQCYPEYLRYYVDNLKKKDLVLVNEKGELQSSIARLEIKYKQIENELMKAKEQILIGINNNTKNESTIKRLKKQLYMVSWERNDLRELIDSFQKDVTVIGNINGEDSKMEVLEKAINGYKNRMAQIEADPSFYTPTDNNKRWIEEKNVLLKDKEELINKCKELEHKCTDLKDQIDHRALKGDFNLRETKVLHYKMNPATEGFNHYENELTNAKQEVEKLKERIKAMQEGISMNLTQVVDNRVNTNASQEIEGLREKLKSQEIQNQRFREVFKKSIQDYKDSVYSLLGYRVDGLQNNIYRLTSQFAFHEEDNLMFQLNEGSMHLLESPFSKSIEEMISLHLGQQRSIPVLLSSITIDLFNKQSMCMTADSTRIESVIN